MKTIVDKGKAPTVAELSEAFGVSKIELVKSLNNLQDYHGVVLHPVSSEIWIMHPFSTAPTNFWIESEQGSWWGNCAWCSLGAAALLGCDLTITTTLGGESKQIVIEVKDGQITNRNISIHFPIPMVKAWENVTYTCSTMLMFETEVEIDSWCKRHGMKKGDVQLLDNVWEFSKVWYGNHLNPDWIKWTVDEAKEIFERFELLNPIWKMPSNGDRF